MITRLDSEIEQFFTKFSKYDYLDDNLLTELIDKTRIAFDLDVVYIIRPLKNSNKLYISHYSSKDPYYKPNYSQLSKNDCDLYSTLYKNGLICDDIQNQKNVLHYGFIDNDFYMGSLVFKSDSKKNWSLEERETIKKLGNIIKIYIISQKNEESQESDTLPVKKALSAIESIYHRIYVVSLSKNYYQKLQSKDNKISFVPVSGKYTDLVNKYINNFIEPKFREDASFRLSIDYILSNINTEERSFGIDYSQTINGHTYWYRISIVLVDMNSDNTKPEHVLFTVKDITTITGERTMNEIAFSLIRRQYIRIGLINLNKDTMVTLQSIVSELDDGKAFAQSYSKAFNDIVLKRILPKFRKKAIDTMSVENLKTKFDSGEQFIEFFCKETINDKDIWVHMWLTPTDDYTPENARVMWYVRNVFKEQTKPTTYTDNVLKISSEISFSSSNEKQYCMSALSDSYFYYKFDVSGDELIKESFSNTDFNIIDNINDDIYPISFGTFIKKWREVYHPVFDTKLDEDIFTIEELKNAFDKNERIIEVELKQTPPKNSKESEFIKICVFLSQDNITKHIIALVVYKDISEKRKNEIQAKMAMRDAYELANRASNAKSEFLNHMSHDIRTPMNAIIGMTAIASTHIDNKERLLDCLQKITMSSKHLLALINEVLDMSKIESGKIDLSEEEFNLSDLIDNLISMVRPLVAQKHHNLETHVNNIEHEKVIGDCLRIQQSFVNFMSNAIKYTPDGGKIKLSISEKPCHNSHLGCYEFIFEDNGIGMSPDFIQHIFEPFTRDNNKMVNKINGTGLGMAIANNLVKMMNGNIKVESTLGIGSKFTVTIYLKLQNTNEISFDEFIDIPVLIVDDDEDTCIAACEILKEMGINGEYVLNGKEAIEKITEHHNKNNDYFSVIIDWKMPDMDGIQTTKEIRKKVGDEIPIIIISAYDWSDIEIEARRAGANAFIGKPLFKSRFVYLFHDLMNKDDETVAESLVGDISHNNFKGKRILLVEDNELNAEIATEILQMSGLDVEHAENGQVAIDMFSTSQPYYYDLIFMDIQMPIVNGYEATRAIRALKHPNAKTIPIVAMTANAFAQDVQMALGSGMNEHIAKPLDFNQLVKTLNKYL